MTTMINPVSAAASFGSSDDVDLLHILQDLNRKKHLDYEKDVRPLYPHLPPLAELNASHFEQVTASIKAAGSLSPAIADELYKLKATLLPLGNTHPAVDACTLGSIYDTHHNNKVREHYQATQENHANILLLSRCVAALERAKLSQDGDEIDLTEIRPLLEEGARIYGKLTEGASMLDQLDLPEDVSKCSKDTVDDFLRKLGEGKILEQGKGPQILTLMRKEAELMTIVFQALQKILEMDSKFKQRVGEKMARGT